MKRAVAAGIGRIPCPVVALLNETHRGFFAACCPKSETHARVYILSSTWKYFAAIVVNFSSFFFFFEADRSFPPFVLLLLLDRCIYRSVLNK